MTLDEVIETLEEIRDDEDSQWELQATRAFNLGLEVIKGVKDYRRWGNRNLAAPFPGETKE